MDLKVCPKCFSTVQVDLFDRHVATCVTAEEYAEQYRKEVQAHQERQFERNLGYLPGGFLWRFLWRSWRHLGRRKADEKEVKVFLESYSGPPPETTSSALGPEQGPPRP